jgi:hypothetical protein
MDMQTLTRDILSAIGAGHDDATRLIRLHTADTGNMTEPLLVERLDGVEQIGPAVPATGPATCPAAFRFTLSVLSTNPLRYRNSTKRSSSRMKKRAKSWPMRAIASKTRTAASWQKV